MDIIADDLQEYVAERCVLKPANSTYAISNVVGKACLDYRINSLSVGAFQTEIHLSESLRFGIAPDLVHRPDHKIIFTHAT